MILFLDFDGVLHSDDVYLDSGLPELRGDGSLMMHAPILEKILESKPKVEIVLSTSWAMAFGLNKCLDYLPKSIASRVIGSTLEGDPRLFKSIPRYYQIELYTIRNDLKKWVAIDDLFSGQQAWPDDLKDHFVLTESDKGLSCINVQARLAKLLENA